MRTWLSRAAVVVLAVSTFTGLAAGAASAATDGIDLVASQSTSTVVGPQPAKYQDQIQQPEGGPKHE